MTLRFGGPGDEWLLAHADNVGVIALVYSGSNIDLDQLQAAFARDRARYWVGRQSGCPGWPSPVSRESPVPATASLGRLWEIVTICGEFTPGA